MALDPVFLDRVPNSAVSLWQQCEDDILRDMARKIKSADYYVPAAQWQETRLRASGMQRRQIVKTLAKYSGKSEAHIQQLMQKAGQASVHNDLNGLKHSQVYRVTDIDKQALNAILRSGAMQTNQTMKNICATTANTATKQFENALDRAWMQVSSGAFDNDTAVQRACRDLADKGIAAIDYGGHVDTIETAVRRAVRTGVNQTALRLSEEICDELGCDLVEVTAHEGARPDHAVWQGQVYSRSGKNPKYKSFVSATGYGTGAGLGGWNCRHSFGPYVEGSARVWTDEKLAALNEKEFNYGGVDMTRYEATQYQRSLERQLRKAKRRQMAGVEGAQQQIDVANAQLDDFCKATGLKRQYQLDDVTGWSGTYNPVSNVPIKKPTLPKVTVQVDKPVIKFTPASTIKEADEFAKQFCDTSQFGSVGVSYSGVHLDIANEINETLNEFYYTFDVGKLGGISAPAKNTKLGKKVDAHAAYSPIRNSILLDRNKTKTASGMLDSVLEDQRLVARILANPERYDLSKVGKRARNVIEMSKASGRPLVAENVGEAITHELGHFLEKSITKEQTAVIKKGMSEYAVNISGYATDSVSEYIAESFTSYMKGETVIDPYLRSVFDGLRK